MSEEFIERRKGERRRGGGRRFTDPLVMSQRDFDMFVAACESDENPNERLKRAAADFKSKYSDVLTTKEPE